VASVLSSLDGLVLEGVKVNKDMLARILKDDLFAKNEVYTRFLSDKPELVTGKPAADKVAAGAGQLIKVEAPFHGQVSEIKVQPGDKVSSSQSVIVLNAMKMLNDVTAGLPGTIKEVLVTKEQQVAEGDVLFTVEASGEQEEDEADGFVAPMKRDKPKKDHVAAPAGMSGSFQGQLANSWYTEGGLPGVQEPTAPVIRSRVKIDDTFKKREAHNIQLIADLTKWTNWAHAAGGDKAVEIHRSRGKMLPRERINMVIDAGTEFMEINTLAAWERYNNEVPGGGIVAGIGVIHGRECMLIANDATVKGGTPFPEGTKKYARAQAIAEQCHLPCIYLVDDDGTPSAGTMAMGGALFKNQAVMSSMRIPQVACVLGRCAAGNAYIPALCDESVIVKGAGSVVLPTSGQKTETPSPDSGSGMIHTSKTGVVDHLADTEQEAMQKIRTIMEHVAGRTPKATLFGMAESEPPLYDPEELLGIIPEDTKIPFDVREVIARIVDGSRFHEFKPRFGATLVCGFAHIDGYPVGILGNNGMLFSESAIKATHFIQICGHRFIPLIFLHNITGFMIGTEYERGGITKDGAKMITAVSCVPVPKYSVVLAGSHGAGNYAMAGPAYDPKFTWLWPNAKISVMGGEQAAGVITYVKDKQRKREGKPPLSKEEVEFMKAPIVQAFESSSTAYHSTSGGFDDRNNCPRGSREVLGKGISVAMNAPKADGAYGVFRM